MSFAEIRQFPITQNERQNTLSFIEIFAQKNVVSGKGQFKII